jgi:hypothetical protein
MAVRMKTAEKIALLSKLAELVETTKAANKSVLADFRELVDKAKFVPVDNLYNTLVSTMNEFEEVLSNDCKVVTEVSTSISKDAIVDENSRASAKRVVAEAEPMLKKVVHEGVSLERNGEEEYDSAKDGEAISALITKISSIRYNFIMECSTEMKKISEPDFLEKVRVLGKNNETFCNQLVAANNKISSELEALGVHINARSMDVETAVASSGSKVDLETKAYKAVPEL